MGVYGRMSLVFLVLCVACSERGVLGTNMAATEGDYECLSGRPHIYSPKITLQGTTCSFEISGLPDFTELLFRQECQRWLSLPTLPDHVTYAYVTNCNDNADGSVTYQAEICCRGCLPGHVHTYSPDVTVTGTDCGSLIHADLVGTPDLTNTLYRQACQSALGLATLPDSVAGAFVSVCNDNGDGSITYNAELCCKQTDTYRCLSCTGEANNYECNFQPGSFQDCAAGEVCQTTYTYNTDYPNTVREVTKSCQSATGCQAAVTDNANTCAHWIPAPSCTYCCEGNYCNYLVDEPTIYVASTPCVSNPCYNGGTCTVVGDTYTCTCPSCFIGNRCESAFCYNSGTCSVNSALPAGYECICPPGRYGDRCESHVCEHGVWTLSSSTTYGYFCYCYIRYGGQTCSDDINECAVGTVFCQNGGTCMDYGTYGLRCICPSGYIGQYCERAVRTCFDSASFRHYATSSVSTTGTCTDVETDYYNYASWMTNSYYRDICKSHMRPASGELFIDTVHGRVESLEKTIVSTCEKGEIYAQYARDFCCPTCYSIPCLNGGWCEQAYNGDYVCKCRFGIFGRNCEYIIVSVYILGDPHTFTFDGALISYQGICKHLFAESTDPGVTYFRVEAKNQRRGSNPSVSFPKYYEITVFGHVIRFGEGGEAYLDGNRVYPDVIFPEFKIIHNGRLLRLETDFGLVVEYDGYWTAAIMLPPEYVGKVQGLAGNYDGVASNDLVTKDGLDVTNDPMSFSLIGNSWQVADPEEPSCTNVDEPNPPPCPEPLRSQIEGPDYCEPIGDTSGVFGSCLSSPAFGYSPFFEICVFDICANDGDAALMEEARCGTAEALAMKCANIGYLVDWRVALNCPLTCPDGMTYVALTSACQPTCQNPDGPELCHLPDTERCVCPGTTVLFEDQCIEASLCGCYEDDGSTHHEIGEAWLSSDCLKLSSCDICESCTRPTGRIVESHHLCAEDEICVAVGDLGDCRAADFCEDDPCENGGTCTNYQCDCAAGFTGEHCSTNIDDCEGALCQNGGTCLDEIDGYSCDCADGFADEHCENKLCTVGWEGPTAVSTFDGTPHTITAAGKFLWLQNIESHNDQCKIQVRVYTTTPRRSSTPEVDWVGVAFGIHRNNKKKFERNFRVSKKQGQVEVRGRGFKPKVKGPGCYNSGPKPLNWKFCFTQSDGVIVVTAAVPDLGCWMTLTYEESGATVNPTTHDRVTVDVSDNYRGKLVGLCGNRDGDPDNDDQFCQGTSGVDCRDKN